MKRTIEIFLQAERLRQAELVHIDPAAHVSDLVAEARRLGMPAEGEAFVFLEDGENPCDPHQTLEAAGIKEHAHVHCHRCRRVRVTVNYQQVQIENDFPPSTTVGKVKTWVDKELTKQHGHQPPRMTPQQAAELALQLCGTTTRPDPDAHLGTLTDGATCAVCFDLVPKDRVQG